MDEYHNILQNLKNKYNLNGIVGSSAIEQTTSKEVTDDIPVNPKPLRSAEAEVKKARKLRNVEKNKADNSKSGVNSQDTVVIFDPDITLKGGIQIKQALEEFGLNYEIRPQIVPNVVTWRQTDNTNEFQERKEVLLLMYWDEVVNLVLTNSLIGHVQSIQEIYPEKSIYLGLYGFEAYFKFWKSKKQSRYREMTKASQKKYEDYTSSSEMSRYELEYALTDLQIMHGCCCRFLETPQDLSNLIIQYTKSIVQEADKLEKREKYKDLEWYIPKDNRDCVAVDKNGNGLHRLWQQQLTMFESVRLETAEAVISEYPTPASLFDAYEKCSESEGRRLLENIPIRRAAGPLTSVRKIGPELSNKMYNFFNTVNGDSII